MTDFPAPGVATPNPGTNVAEKEPKVLPAALEPLVQPLEPARAGVLLVVAAVFGLLGNFLVSPRYLGIGSSLWAIAVLAALAWFSRRNPADAPTVGDGANATSARTISRGLYALALAAALCFSWRDTPALRIASVVLYFLAIIAIQLNGFGVPLRRTPFLVALLHVLQTGYAWLLLPVFQVQCWHRAAALRPRTAFDGTLRGTVIAGMLLLVFGSLLGKADVRFASLLLGFLPENGAAFLSDVFWVLFFAFAALVIITNRPKAHPAFVHTPEGLVQKLDEEGQTLSRLDLVIPMVALDVLFAVFVYLQLGYFFGGEAYVHTTMGVTYAEYARRGFFELLAVAALVLPLQLLFDWWLRKESPGARSLFHRLAMVQGVLLLCILASAAHRMALYQQAYGLTQLRVYASAGIVWIGATMLWHAATVLRARRERFFFGAAVGSVVFFFALGVLNPDALVARVNTARIMANAVDMDGPRLYGSPQSRTTYVGLDVQYLMTLSADAIPALHAALPHLPWEAQSVLDSYFDGQAKSDPMRYARTWSWSRWRARRALSGT